MILCIVSSLLIAAVVIVIRVIKKDKASWVLLVLILIPIVIIFAISALQDNCVKTEYIETDISIVNINGNYKTFYKQKEFDYLLSNKYNKPTIEIIEVGTKDYIFLFPITKIYMKIYIPINYMRDEP